MEFSCLWVVYFSLTLELEEEISKKRIEYVCFAMTTFIWYLLDTWYQGAWSQGVSEKFSLPLLVNESRMG